MKLVRESLNEFINPKTDEYDLEDNMLLGTKYNYRNLKPGTLIKPLRNMGLTRSTGKVCGTHNGNYINKESILVIVQIFSEGSIRIFRYVQIRADLQNDGFILDWDYINKLSEAAMTGDLHNVYKVLKIWDDVLPLQMAEKQFNNRFNIMKIK